MFFLVKKQQQSYTIHLFTLGKSWGADIGSDVYVMHNNNIHAFHASEYPLHLIVRCVYMHTFTCNTVLRYFVSYGRKKILKKSND